MPETDMCPTLLISGSIALTIVLSIFFGGLLSYWNTFEFGKKPNLYDNLLKVLWLLAGVFAIITIVFIWLYTGAEDTEKGVFKLIISSLAPLGIILASLIASASVMKSIETSKQLQVNSIEVNKKLQERSILENTRQQRESIQASRKLQEESIAENRKLKDLESTNLHRSQLLFMIDICSQIKYKYTLNTFLPKTKSFDSTVSLSKAKNEINKIKSLWDRLMDDKYFIFINDEAFAYFEYINHDFYELEDIVSNNNRSNISIATIETYTGSIASNLNEMIDILKNEKTNLTPTEG